MIRWFVSFAAVLLTGCQSMIPTGTITPERIAEIVASPDRSEADRTNDRLCRPGLMLSCIGLRPGMVALAVSAGGGYTTGLIARAVVPTGKVYAQLPKNPARVEARAKNPGLGQIVPVVPSFDDP